MWFFTHCGAYAKAVVGQKATCHKLSAECYDATASGKKVLDRIANGLPPKHGMEWPLATDQVIPMGEDELEQLWPDRRKGSGGTRKRRPIASDELLGAALSAERSDLELQDGMQPEVQSLAELEVETGDYELHEDEDPWGLLGAGLDEEL